MRSVLLGVGYIVGLVALTSIHRRQEVQGFLIDRGWLRPAECSHLIPFSTMVHAGESRRSCEGNLTLLMHHDGVLALYDDSHLVWRSAWRSAWWRRTYATDYWAQLEKGHLKIGRGDTVLSSRPLVKISGLSRHLQDTDDHLLAR